MSDLHGERIREMIEDLDDGHISVWRESGSKLSFLTEVNAMKEKFIRVLAEYLAGNQAAMSARLSREDPDAKVWADLRNRTPLTGWVSVGEAEKVLTEFLR